MLENWFENEDATARVQALLERSGLSLELDVEQICRVASHDWNQRLEAGLHVSSQSLTYATRDNPLVYRDIDQLFEFYEELEIGQSTGVQLMISCPIECKSRKDVQHFAFPMEDTTTNFPILGFVGSQMLSNAIQSAGTLLSAAQRCRMASLIIQDGKTPSSITDENLVYNAAGALYDYVAEDLNHEEDEGKPDEFISAQLAKFKSYLRRNRFYWAQSLGPWLKEIRQKHASEYYDYYFRDGRFYTSLQVSIPIVCLNGRIFTVTKDTKFKFVESNLVLTHVRKQGWPVKRPYAYYSAAGDVPVLVTNPTGLRATLEVARSFALAFRNSLLQTPAKLERRWPLESELYLAACEEFFVEREHRYRSGFEWPLHP